MKEQDSSQFNPENYELPLKGHVRTVKFYFMKSFFLF